MQPSQQRALATRTACDRCREQKLRCLRSQGQGAGTACVRCARAGASCVTGAPRPLGRSRAGPDDAHRRRPRRSVFVSVTAPRSAALASPTPPATAALAGSSREELVTSPPTRRSEGIFERFHGPLTADPAELSGMLLDEGAPGSEETPDEAFVIDALDLGFPDDDDEDTTALSTLVGVSDTGAFFPMELEADLRGLYSGGGDQLDTSQSLSAPSGTHNPSFCLDPAFLLRSLPGSGSALDVAGRLPPGQPSPGPSGDVLVRLARLNQGIAHQLSRMDTFVMGVPSAALLDSCVDKVADLQANPILQALESTAELAAIIRQVVSSSSSSPSSALNMPVVLMCLSGHIQLLQVYDAIFSHVHRSLSGLHDVLGFFEDLPGFAHISGLPPVKGDLYIKITIQVAQHNLGSLERALGLPADLCLSARRTCPRRGLLSYADSLEPFRSIMGQACNPSEKSGRALVASIRMKVGNILGLLRDDC